MPIGEGDPQGKPAPVEQPEPDRGRRTGRTECRRGTSWDEVTSPAAGSGAEDSEARSRASGGRAREEPVTNSRIGTGQRKTLKQW
jgi:hypothetical protein